MRIRSQTIVVTIVILIVLVVSREGVTAESYTGSMIDAHSHPGASFGRDMIRKVMGRNNVSRQIVMARYYPGPAGDADRPGNDELAANLADKYPDRFIPLAGMQRQKLTEAE